MTQSLQIGTAGWSIPGRFGEELPAPGSHLERYGRGFRCCEINSSFYRSHRPETWAKWAAAVPADFKFSVKAPKTITHLAKLDCSSEELQAFLEQAVMLGEKLGPLLFQLPPKLLFERNRAEAFLSLLRDVHSGPVVFEPRHPSWFTSEASSVFHSFRIARAAVDPAVIPEASSPGGWTGLAYFRLHGSPRVYYSDYEEERLKTLAAAMGEQHAAGQVWCIFDNTASGAALGNALRLQQLTSTMASPELSRSPSARPVTSRRIQRP
jgi:uncharacterized protein YecE (DUF72 family)